MAMPQRGEEARAPRREEAVKPALSFGSFTISALFGVGALVLAIIGLAGVVPGILAAVGLLSIGAAFLFSAAALINEGVLLRPLPGTRAEARLPKAHPSGAGAWLLASAASILLGILAFVYPATSSWVAFGGILAGLGLLVGGAMARTTVWAPGLGRANWLTDFGRGSDLWGGILAVVIGALSAPLQASVFVNNVFGLGAAPAARAAGVAATQTGALIVVLVIGTTFLVSGMMRAWQYGRRAVVTETEATR